MTRNRVNVPVLWQNAEKTDGDMIVAIFNQLQAKMGTDQFAKPIREGEESFTIRRAPRHHL